MSLEELAAATTVVAITSKRRKERKKRKTREHWVKPWLERRNQLGVSDTLLSELRLEEEEEYKNYLKMTPGCFDKLFELMKEDITKKPHKYATCNPSQIEACCNSMFSLYWRILRKFTASVPKT